MPKKLASAVKVIGLLTVIGAAAAKLAPLLKNANPKMRKKFETIINLLIELKEEMVDLGSMAAKEVKKKR